MHFDPAAYAARREEALLVAFLDLTRFAVQSAKVPDLELAERLDEYYLRVSTRIAGAGGHVVKYIGDGVLVVFHQAAADAAVETLLGLEDEIDAWMESLGWECRLTAKVHVGSVVVGPLAGQLDVIGQTVNNCARLPMARVALSEEAVAALSDEVRARIE